MNKELLSQYNEQARQVLAPVQALNQLAVDNAEKFVALQAASLERYVAFGFSQLRAVSEVNDAEAFQAYLGKQNELVRSVSDEFVEDAKAAAKLGSEFSEKVQELGQESIKAVTQKAA